MVTLAMTVSAATFAPRVAGMSTTPSTEWFTVSGPDAATNPRRFVSSSDSLKLHLIVTGLGKTLAARIKLEANHGGLGH